VSAKGAAGNKLLQAQAIIMMAADQSDAMQGQGASAAMPNA
jgi:hypothetical protein